MEEKTIALAADVLRHADALLITAGAGLGVDSGFPDFRGSTGFWNAYPPYAKLGIEFEELACPDTLADNPALFWGFYEHRRVLYRDTEPHGGYAILRKFAETRSTFVFTSNVDGHFHRAGFADGQILECHGTIHSFQCARPCGTDIWPVSHTGLSIDHSTMLAVGDLPRCQHCGEFARPNVLMFGDDTWIGDRTAGQRKRYERWLATLRGKRLAILELGAGTAIPTVRQTSESIASRHGATVIRINPRESSLDGRRGISIPGTALATLQAISAML